MDCGFIPFETSGESQRPRISPWKDYEALRRMSCHRMGNLRILPRTRKNQRMALNGLSLPENLAFGNLMWQPASCYRRGGLTVMREDYQSVSMVYLSPKMARGLPQLRILGRLFWKLAT